MAITEFFIIFIRRSQTSIFHWTHQIMWPSCSYFSWKGLFFLVLPQLWLSLPSPALFLLELCCQDLFFWFQAHPNIDQVQITNFLSGIKLPVDLYKKMKFCYTTCLFCWIIFEESFYIRKYCISTLLFFISVEHICSPDDIPTGGPPYP